MPFTEVNKKLGQLAESLRGKAAVMSSPNMLDTEIGLVGEIQGLIGTAVLSVNEAHNLAIAALTPAPAEEAPADPIPADEELAALDLKALKTLAKAHGVTVPSKATVEEVRVLLAAERDKEPA